MLNSSDILYFDGNCPNCLAEMRLLNRYKNDSLSLVNVHDIQDYPANELPDKFKMLEILHLQTDEKKWLKGLDANVRAWRHTRLGWFFMPLRWPIIRSIADRFYYRWAEKRACRLGYSDQCSAANSSSPPTT